MSEEKLNELVAKYAIKWGGLYETGIDIEAILSDEAATQYDSEVPEEKQSIRSGPRRGRLSRRYWHTSMTVLFPSSRSSP